MGAQPPFGQREADALVGLSDQRVAQLERRVLDLLAATGPPPSLSWPSSSSSTEHLGPSAVSSNWKSTAQT